ncbi:transcription initiation factor TFIID subunit 4-like [Cynocephalus volans]|uniref:transcription initiation factor TFIID subunit 4-like n=1 Tax=Cynocephalus volans TaxID=110931 RepID=UPI002FCC50F6
MQPRAPPPRRGCPPRPCAPHPPAPPRARSGATRLLPRVSASPRRAVSPAGPLYLALATPCEAARRVQKPAGKREGVAGCKGRPGAAPRAPVPCAHGARGADLPATKSRTASARRGLWALLSSREPQEARQANDQAEGAMHGGTAERSRPVLCGHPLEAASSHHGSWVLWACGPHSASDRCPLCRRFLGLVTSLVGGSIISNTLGHQDQSMMDTALHRDNSLGCPHPWDRERLLQSLLLQKSSY